MQKKMATGGKGKQRIKADKKKKYVGKNGNVAVGGKGKQRTRAKKKAA